MKQSLIVFCLVQLVSVANAGSEPKCSDLYFSKKGTGAERLSTVCSAMYQKPGTFFKKYQDGSVLPNPYSWPAEPDGHGFKYEPRSASESEIKKLMTVNNRGLYESQTTFAQLKVLLIDRVTKGRKDNELKPAELELVKRVRAIDLDVAKREDIWKMGCSGLPPQGMYEKTHNRILICPESTHLPFEGMIAYLAHELAHVASICSQEVYAYRPEAIKELEAGDVSRFRKCGMSDGMAKLEAKSVLGYVRNGFRGLSLERYAKTVHGPYLARLVECGIVDAPRPFDSKMEGYPFSDLKKCSLSAASTEGAAKARAPHGAESLLNEDQPEEADFEAPSKESLTKHRNERFGATAVKKGEELEKESLNLSSTCAPNTEELFADALAAQLTADYIDHHGARIRADYQDALISHTDSCRLVNEAIGYHPRSDERLATLLQHPQIQRRLGCDEPSLRAACGSPNPPSAPTSTSKNSKNKKAVK